ncbi:MAG: hypothetical protein WBP45_12335 [Daejeonella sp.]
MKKLNLEQLHAELDVINEAESNSIKGGDWIMDFYNSHGSGTYSGSQVMEWGNDTYGGGGGGYGSGGGDWWQGYGNFNDPIQLNEVVISSGNNNGSGTTIGIQTGNGWDYYNNSGGGFTWDPDSSGYYSGGGSYGGGDSNNPTLTQQPWYQAISTMLSTMELSASMATVSAEIMGVTLPGGFVFAGHALTLTSLADNTVQLSEGFNYNDAAQLGVGAVLIGTAFIATAPVSVPVVFIGGLGLFVWELAEGQNGW